MSEKNELCRSDDSCNTTAVAERSVATVKPRYQSRYDDEAWEVTVRLPGVKKSQVDVTVENEILDVKAARRFEKPEAWRPLGDYVTERNYRLRLDVGPEVDESRISAELEDGILTLRLPLREEVKPRSIEVK